MNTLRYYFILCFLSFFFFQTSSAQEKSSEPPRVPRSCYESLLKLDPVQYDTTETKVPYQTFLFRHQREYMIVVADTANFYSFNYKRVKQNGVKVDSLSANSLAFDLSICKLFDVKELTLKERKRTVSDLQVPHFYTFSKRQQRLYASMRAVETGKARTFVGKSLAGLKEIPKIFSFIKAKPNEKLQAKMQAMKDQTKKMKDEVKKAKDIAGKAQENLAKLQEEKKKIEEEVAKYKKEKEEKDKKEAIAVSKDSTKTNTTVKDNKNPKDKSKNNSTVTTNPKDKNKAGKDSLITASVADNAKKLNKKDSIVLEMNRVLKEIEIMGNIDELNAKKKQLLDQKDEFENTKKKKDTDEPKVDAEKRKTEMMAKIHEINDLLRDLADDKAPDIVSKRLVMKNRRDYLLKEIKKMEINPQ